MEERKGTGYTQRMGPGGDNMGMELEALGKKCQEGSQIQENFKAKQT